ncbi:ATP-binding protein [Treponema sp. TIM-1]|uniref:ATP-binding protein n=1 Tax=Treponema sp. TIM-1 TaxID=2898417 RepID=UPI0039809427
MEETRLPNMPRRILPIGIQDFEDLRRKGYLYVDKTALVWKLVTEGKPYFLSRPRRFGKSLLITTLKAYFEGKKDLFDGLALGRLETEWKAYPVVHLDFNPSRYDSVASLNYFVADRLEKFEKKYGVPSKGGAIESRFQNLIEGIYEKTGRQVVVLVDEYDKPLLESMDNEGLNAELRAALKPFYGVLKSADTALRFVMLTGVTRFSKVSIFSDLNQLREIGMSETYAALCGITEKELVETFTPELEALAQKNQESFEQTLEAVRRNFNGYHFAKNSESVYNPFSLLNTFANQEIRYYWFATGTPTFLFKELERTRFEIIRFKDHIEAPESAINDYQPGDGTPIPLLYQSGYLTISGYDQETRTYRLGFPNEEVQYGFLNNLYKYLFPAANGMNDLDVWTFIKALRSGETDTFLTQLKAFFASVPYDLYFEKGEKYYQTIFYLVFTLLGQFAESEVRSAAGRADAVVKIRNLVYVFEFKLDKAGSAEEALRQIDEKGYLIPYSAGGHRLIKAGVVFDTGRRTLGDWRIQEA